MIDLQRLRAVLRKELTQLLRDRITLLLIFMMPLLELFFFAYAVNLSVDHIPTAVCDLSLDVRSRDFIDALVASGYFDIAEYAAGEADVIAALDEGRVRAGIVIPPDFAAQVARGQGEVLIILDGSDTYSVQAAYSAATSIAQHHALDLMVERLRRQGQTFELMPVASSVRVLYNPTLDGLIFIVPALIAMLLQILTVNLTAQSIVREWELGTIEQLLATPIRPLELILGKLLPNLIIAAVALVLIALIGFVGMGVPFRGSVLLFLFLSLLFAISGLGLGLLVSTVAHTQNEAESITSMLMLLSMLLTGFIYPREPMPAIVRLVGDLIPLTYFVRIVRGVVTRGVGLTLIWQDVAALAIYAALVMYLAARFFHLRLD